MKAEEFLKILNGIDSKFIDEADEYNSENNKSVSVTENKYRYLALIAVSAAAFTLVVSANYFIRFNDRNNYEAEIMVTETNSYFSENTCSTFSAEESSVSEDADKTIGNIQISFTSVSRQEEFVISETLIPDTGVFEETDITELFSAPVNTETDITEPVSSSVNEETGITESVSAPVTEKTDITEIFTSDAGSTSETQIPSPPVPNPVVTTVPSIIPDIFYDADKKYKMIYQKEAGYENTGQKTGTEKLVFYTERGEEEFIYDIYSVPDNDENLIIIRIRDRYYMYTKIINKTDEEE